jgi:hypothetical protein
VVAVERLVMNKTVQSVAVVRGAPSSEIQALFRAFAGRIAPTANLAGLIEDGEASADPACGAGQLRSLRDASRYPIFQDLGPAATACRLDASGVISACEAVRRDIEAGCDLLILSKFGKLEAERSGLMSAFAAAIDANVPILTSVSPKFDEAWSRFAAPLFVVLPPDAGQIDRWWRDVQGTGRPPASVSGYAA